MKFVITLGDAVELGFIVVLVAVLAARVAVEWCRSRKGKDSKQ